MRLNKPKRIIFLILAPLLALSACATIYQEEGIFSNGYSDYQKSNDSFVVTFRANEHTLKKNVMKYALQRASEITQQNGYSYFTILDQMDVSPYPSIRLTIQCFSEKPEHLSVIDPSRFLEEN